MSKLSYKLHRTPNKIDVYKLSDNIFKLDIQHGWGANVLVLSGDDGILLVDSGYRQTSDDLQHELNKISDAPVKYIINSHSHGDHIGGNRLLDKGGSVIAHQKAVESLSQLRHVIGVKDKYSIGFNNEKIMIQTAEGGHSSTDVIIHFTDSNIVFLGDMYLSECFPLIGSGRENVPTLIKRLKEVSEMINNEAIIISGHGRDSSLDDLRVYIGMVEETTNIVVNEMKKGKSLKQIKREDVLHDWREWSGNISFITKESWITDIYESYIKEILN